MQLTNLLIPIQIYSNSFLFYLVYLTLFTKQSAEIVFYQLHVMLNVVIETPKIRQSWYVCMSSCSFIKLIFHYNSTNIVQESSFCHDQFCILRLLLGQCYFMWRDIQLQLFVASVTMYMSSAFHCFLCLYIAQLFQTKVVNF